MTTLATNWQSANHLRPLAIGHRPSAIGHLPASTQPSFPSNSLSFCLHFSAIFLLPRICFAPRPPSLYSAAVNPVALITGASRGIGRGIAIQLAKIGFDLVINYATNESAAQQ